MENLKDAKTCLAISRYDVEDIFSYEEGVTQNTKKVTDIQAIRNAVQ